MELKGKHILLFTVVILVLAILIMPKPKYTIDSVIDGNTIVLKNGAIIKLIGISSSVEGQEELKRLINSKIDLKPDHTSYFDKDKLKRGMTVYSYVLLKDSRYECLNARLLKNKLAMLSEEPYLVDSLIAFRQYAGVNSDGTDEGERQTPQPTPTPPQVIDYSQDDIIIPKYSEKEERKHTQWHQNGNLDVEMLEEACDYNSTYTKSFANQLAAKGKSGEFCIEQVCSIFDYCYKKWRYVNDPDDCEYLAKASESIALNSLTGDCDDFAILMTACMLSVGGNARIILAEGFQGGHAYAELDVTNMDENTILRTIQKAFPQFGFNSLHIRNGDGKRWLNLDWQANYPGGPYFSANSWSVFYRKNGEWVWINSY